MKALFKYDPDMDKLDSNGWSPLHVAARFNQLKSVELLLKKKANANLEDSLGNKPSALTSSDEIRALLMRHERQQVFCICIFSSKVKDFSQDEALHLQFSLW